MSAPVVDPNDVDLPRFEEAIAEIRDRQRAAFIAFGFEPAAVEALVQAMTAGLGEAVRNAWRGGYEAGRKAQLQ